MEVLLPYQFKMKNIDLDRWRLRKKKVICSIKLNCNFQYKSKLIEYLQQTKVETKASHCLV